MRVWTKQEDGNYIVIKAFGLLFEGNLIKVITDGGIITPDNIETVFD